jgi:imidazolonepropionase-like amidohydrolase
MRNIILICLFLFCMNADGQEGSRTAIIHVNIVDVEKGGLLKDQTVLISSEIIADIFPSSKKRDLKGWRVINAKGKYLIPGLIDSHIHLHYFLKINQPQLLQAPFNVFLYYGVTGIREASGSVYTKEMIGLRDSIATGKIVGPKIYVSGIATSTNLKKFNVVSYTELVGKFKEMGVDGIKVKLTTFTETKEIIDAAHALQLPVYGHTTNPWEPDSTNILGDFTPGIVDYGIDGVIHTAGYPPVGSKQLPLAPPGDSSDARWLYSEALWLYADVVTEDLLIRKMIAHNVWLEPTLTVEQLLPAHEQYRNDPSLQFFLTTYDEYASSFPRLTPGQKDSMLQVFRRKQLFVKKFYEAGGMVLAGTDNLFGTSLHKELELLAGAGLPPAAALKAATYNNAKALGWLKELGTITRGKRASLVLLDKNPLDNISNTREINTVISNGQVFDKYKLAILMEQAEAMIRKR